MDHHQLHVEELVRVGADLVGDGADESRELLLDAGVDRLAQPRRQVVPELWMLALHDPVDHVVDLAAGVLQDVLGDRLRVEPLVEVAGAAQLRDPLVDGDRAHLRRPRGDDPLPAEAALHHARDLLDPARQHVGERLQAGHPDAAKPDRVEEHPDPGPVGHVADRAGEQRDREQAECLAVHGDRGRCAPDAG